MASKHTLESWFNDVARDDQKEGQLTAVALMFCVNASRKEVYTLKLGSREWTTADLAKFMRNKAESYAAEMSGSQQFELQAFYGGRSEPEANKLFRVAGELDLDGLQTEGPTKEGMFQQGMRHLEAATQACYAKDKVVFEQMSKVIDVLSSRFSEASHELNDATKLVRELVQEKIISEDERETKRLQFQRATDERKAMLRLLPPLANTISGKEIFPQSTADSALIESIEESLSEEQIMALSGILKPEQMGLLMARFEKKLKKTREEKEGA